MDILKQKHRKKITDTSLGFIRSTMDRIDWNQRLIGINRNTLIAYLGYLQDAGLTRNLYKDAAGLTILQKPQKIFLENSNLAYALAGNTPEAGNTRETFFASQVGFNHALSYPEQGDFLVNDRYLFEVGGKKKGKRQIGEAMNGCCNYNSAQK
jgi:predicted AAA+ superfamily ATPase